jgi:GH24 family phage-related lysozyme (muramidase)
LGISVVLVQKTVFNSGNLNQVLSTWFKKCNRGDTEGIIKIVLILNQLTWFKKCFIIKIN